MTSSSPRAAEADDVVGHMRYLESQGLDEAVSRALMQAINERAPDGRRRVAELLCAAEASQQNIPPRGAERADTEEALRAQVSLLTAELEAVKRGGSVRGRPSVSDGYRDMMARLFMVLDTNHSGELSNEEIKAFSNALGRGAQYAPLVEASATKAFIRVLHSVVEGKSTCSRNEWMTYVPPHGAFTPSQESTFIAIINEILENPAAVTGMLTTFRAEVEVSTRQMLST
ncbi:hypothetical protein AB1Y20_023193 [Prymnesium parvum]|uniref:EF-hand domain-containing protein n=1 Tax=Prymnesium parvum TaxID=97485 RepID=A0AB34JFH3_PRYPA